MLLATTSSCGDGVLDPNEMCDPGLDPEDPHACPSVCRTSDRCMTVAMVGSGCQRRCETRPVDQRVDGDGCCPEGAQGAQDSDCASCGDGIIGPGETCDPPETCLAQASCKATNACLKAKLTGDPSTCNARCELSPITACESGDGCCPEACSQMRDGDCSASCGDGVVDRGETCEPGDAAAPCSTDCDDHDPCTKDLRTGSAENCNASCTHTSINAPADGDGCCPKGANAQNDDDCKPHCGNGIREPGEDCDSEPGCSAHCEQPAPLKACLSALDAKDMSDECRSCACAECSAEVVRCRANTADYATSERAIACTMVAECAERTTCPAGNCYCGSSASCAIPNGPCKAEFEAATHSSRASRVLACASDPSCAVEQGLAEAACLLRYCSASCAKPAPSATQASRRRPVWPYYGLGP